jgi:uncharacterized OB-fold protein
LAFVEVSGRGRVFSYTTNHQKNTTGFEAVVPYTNVIVELEEESGLRLISDLAGVEGDWVRIGAPVEVVFQALDEGIHLPQFVKRRGPE